MIALTMPPLARRALQALLCMAALGNAGLAMAGDVYVIAHPDTKLSAEVVRDIYIGEKQFSNDIKLVPLDNAAAQEGFLSKVLKLDPQRYNNLWIKKSFRDALNPPVLRYTDKEIFDFVRKTPGAIAYVGTAPPAGIALVHKY